MPDDDDHHHGQNQSSDLQLARSRRTEKVYKNSNVEGPDKRLMMSRRRLSIDASEEDEEERVH